MKTVAAVGVILLGLAGVCFGEAARAAERVLRFGEGESLGLLYVMDEEGPGEVETFHHWIRSGPQWERFAELRGDVAIPAGKIVKLQIHDAHNKDLSVLEKLDPNAIHTVQFYRAGFDTRPVSSKKIEQVCKLTGLRFLDMSAIGAPASSMKHLAKLTNLEGLALAEGLTDAGLRYVCRVRSLKRLAFRQNKVTDAGIQQIGNLEELRELDLGGEGLTDESLKYVAKLGNLEYLLLWGLGFTDNGLGHVANIHSLKMLHVAQQWVTDGGLKHLGEMENLERLCLYDSSISDAGLKFLVGLKKLKMLDVGRRGEERAISDAGAVHLAKMKSLERLEINCNILTDAGLANLAKLENLRVLNLLSARFLDASMDRYYYTDEGLRRLSNLKKLEEFDMVSPFVTDAGIGHISGLANLKRLHIMAQQLTNKGFTDIGNIKLLEWLELQIDQPTIGGLAKLNSLSNLEYLDLNGIRQDDSGMDISALKNLRRLSLYLRRERRDGKLVTDQLQAKDLACLAKLKNLTEIQMGGGESITDEAMGCFSGLSKLEFLNITGPNLTDDCLRHLSGLKKLWRLRVCDSSIDGSGFGYLEGCESLRWMEIRTRSRFNNTELAELKAKLPLEHVDITRLDSDGKAMQQRR